MGFKENLKNELVYNGLLVKELSAKTGINKYTLDNYLSRCCSPSAEAVVKIAQVLGVSAEYLVTGCEAGPEKTLASLHPDLRSLIRVIDQLEDPDRKIVVKTAIHLADALYRRDNKKTGDRENL
ncbi:MAG: helix-turn-helix domain-containing protein [Treponema sp.]|jgi:transcriptional regulator with XRE-family HTH domain|nr:helix-turn-helix domain-containing protein [Treponema sp.]